MTISFKQLIKDGHIKRGDLLRAQHADIHTEPGFNLNLDPETFEKLAQSLADFILAGGVIPPLLLRVADDGTLFIVDGHLRHRALAIAIERTKDDAIRERLAVVSFMPFTGNDADRLDVIFTSREGRQLSDLERAMGYKRYSNMGFTSDEIAMRVRRSRPHVESYLLLANANTDVQRLVQSGKVKVTVAIAAIRKHGEKAGEFLAGGKKTVADVKGRPLPRKVADELEGTLSWFTDEGLNPQAKQAIAKAENDPAQYANAVVSVSAGALVELMKAAALAANTREQYATKAREAAAKASQADIEDAA